MDKQKQIEEMAQCKNEYGFICCDCVYRKSACERYKLAEELYNAGYRKIPEGAVVLTVEKYEENYINGYGDGYGEGADYGFQEAVMKFAERLKEEYKRIGEGLQDSYDEVIGSDLPERCVPDVLGDYGYIDAIDEIAKELTEGKE